MEMQIFVSKISSWPEKLNVFDIFKRTGHLKKILSLLFRRGLDIVKTMNGSSSESIILFQTNWHIS